MKQKIVLMCARHNVALYVHDDRHDDLMTQCDVWAVLEPDWSAFYCTQQGEGADDCATTWCIELT